MEELRAKCHDLLTLAEPAAQHCAFLTKLAEPSWRI
jgi:hypothetical protein